MTTTYTELCDQLFDLIEEYLEEHDDELHDYENNGEICEVTLADGAKIIINRQPGNEEIWLAAKSGGYHFRHNGTDWIDTRDNRKFFDRLTECLQQT